MRTLAIGERASYLKQHVDAETPPFDASIVVRFLGLVCLAGAVLLGCARSELDFKHRIARGGTGGSAGGGDTGARGGTGGGAGSGGRLTGGSAGTGGSGGTPSGGSAPIGGRSASGAGGVVELGGEAGQVESGGRGQAGFAGAELAGGGGMPMAGGGGMGATGTELTRCEAAFTPDLEGSIAADAGTQPASSASSDFDRDGHLDVATGNYDGSVSVLFGDGTGALASGVRYPTGLYPIDNPPYVYSEIHAADVNDDGTLDLVVADRVRANLSVLLGSPDGTFGAPMTRGLGGNWLVIALDDMDGDGHVDIAVGRESGSFTGVAGVLYGVGDGTFGGEVDYWEGYSVGYVNTGDFDEDGWRDLVVLAGSVHAVLLGTDGGLELAHEYPAYTHNHFVGVDDFDGDGHLDLVAANACGREVFPLTSVGILLGAGDGSFAEPIVTATGGWCLEDFTVADVNGDSAPDAILSPWTVLLGEGDGTFGEPITGSETIGSNLVGNGDFDEDGKLDLVTTGGDWVKVQRGNGDGTFEHATELSARLGTGSVVLEDLDQDGALDLAVVGYDENGIELGFVSVAHGLGDGTFGPVVDFTTGDGPVELTTGDLNLDGIPDLLTLSYTSESLGVLLGDGAGAYLPVVEYYATNTASAVVVGDLDGDAKPDVVTVRGWSAGFEIWRGNGDGTLGAAVTEWLDARPSDAALADVNGDDVLDLVLSNYETWSVSVLVGNGDGTFASAESFATGKAPWHLVTGDFNGDGHVDLVTANDDSFSFLPNDGNGWFAEHTEYDGIEGDTSVTDFDHDGDLDVVLSGGGLWIAQGAGDGTFECVQQFALGGYVGAHAAGELNGDERLDIVLATNDGLDILMNRPR